MERFKTAISFIFYLLLILLLTDVLYIISNESLEHNSSSQLILDSSDYHDEGIASIRERLAHRIQIQPFNIPSLILFICAILHTLFSHQFNVFSEKLRSRNIRLKEKIVDSFGVEILRFMGEVEVIFGLWVIPLAILMSTYFDWWTTINYLNTRDYTEALFVVVIMAIASTKPIFKFTEGCLKFLAQLGKESVEAWWITILTIGPIVGSFITEPGAMTLSAMLLSHHFYRYKPSPKLAYGTLGLLFTNISVGGVFTSFAAPPVLIISTPWNWDTSFMMQTFGFKAALGIVVANLCYYMLFKEELKALNKKKIAEKGLHHATETLQAKIPFWITLTNVTFLAWMVVHGHYPVIFIGSFLLFLGFHKATQHYQSDINLKPPILVGFFLAGLVVHGSLQAWWISPLMSQASEGMLMVLSIVLTSFTDNAEITFLASLIPSFTDGMKYAVVAGAVTGGGLTVIANAPNPLGQSILNKHFQYGVSTGKLFLAALTPTLFMALSFWFFRTVS